MAKQNAGPPGGLKANQVSLRFDRVAKQKKYFTLDFSTIHPVDLRSYEDKGLIRGSEKPFKLKAIVEIPKAVNQIIYVQQGVLNPARYALLNRACCFTFL